MPSILLLCLLASALEVQAVRKTVNDVDQLVKVDDTEEVKVAANVKGFPNFPCTEDGAKQLLEKYQTARVDTTNGPEDIGQLLEEDIHKVKPKWESQLALWEADVMGPYYILPPSRNPLNAVKDWVNTTVGNAARIFIPVPMTPQSPPDRRITAANGKGAIVEYLKEHPAYTTGSKKNYKYHSISNVRSALEYVYFTMIRRPVENPPSGDVMRGSGQIWFEAWSSLQYWKTMRADISLSCTDGSYRIYKIEESRHDSFDGPPIDAGLPST